MIVRNLLVAGALSATAAILPARQAKAQSCDAGCAACYQYWTEQLVACESTGGYMCYYEYELEIANCPGE
jgi:hypothetical protein